MAKPSKKSLGKPDALAALHEYRGAYTDLRDLIRLRYAAREINDLADYIDSLE